MKRHPTLSGGTLWFVAATGVEGLDVDDTEGDTEETEDTEETDDILSLFSGVTSPSRSLKDALFRGSEGTAVSILTSVFCSEDLCVDAGSSFDLDLASAGLMFFTGGSLFSC